MFSRYNLLALALSGVCLVLEVVYAPSLVRLILAGAMTAVLALKLPIDKVIKRRKGSGQVREVEAEGMQLDRSYKMVEGATAVILLLAFASFVLSFTQ